jgi:hypothetical protein
MMTTRFIDHHTLAIWSVTNASLELISTQPETDAMVELRELLEYQFDILDCIMHSRHFGSDSLDAVIEDCNKVLNQVKEHEDR